MSDFPLQDVQLKRKLARDHVSAITKSGSGAATKPRGEYRPSQHQADEVNCLPKKYDQLVVFSLVDFVLKFLTGIFLISAKALFELVEVSIYLSERDLAEGGSKESFRSDILTYVGYCKEIIACLSIYETLSQFERYVVYMTEQRFQECCSKLM